MCDLNTRTWPRVTEEKEKRQKIEGRTGWEKRGREAEEQGCNSIGFRDKNRGIFSTMELDMSQNYKHDMDRG